MVTLAIMRRVLPLVLLALSAPGCVRVHGSTAAATTPTPAPDGSAPWKVGAAVVDITPPVGYGMAGHAMEARSSVGVWTRLRAQAIAIEDRDGTPVVLIATDLWAIPAALPDALTQRLQTEHGMSALGRAQVILAATHTHHGPGHVHTAPAYADHAGSEPGFDPVLFDWLTERLAGAAADAYARREAATLTLHTTAVPTVARNRSLTPALENPEMPALLEANAGLPGCDHPANATWIDTEQAADPCHAVDPLLHALVARRPEDDGVIAVAAVFGVHATAMPNRTPVYHGDLFGIAARRAQGDLVGAGHDDAVVAVFNGPEGDVSPNWRAQGRSATTALGDGLGQAIVATLDTDGLSLRGTVGYGLVRVPMSSAEVVTPTTSAPGRTGRRALPGRSQFGGAEDGRTWLHDRGFDEGRTVRRARRKGHGAKRPALPPALIALRHPKAHFPSFVPLGVVELGPLSLVALPGEFTTAMGQRIESRVSAARDDVGPAIGIGLAGEYLSYFTTPQEYDLQHYEGASMMYGRLAGEAMAQAAEALVRQPRVEGVGTFDYRGRGKTSTARLARTLRGPAKEAAETIATTLELDTSVTLRFEDGRARWSDDAQTTPRVRVEVRSDAGWERLADDEGDALVTYVTKAGRGRWMWASTWLEPFAPLEHRGKAMRLHVQRLDGSTACSAPFDAEAVTRGADVSLTPAPC